MANDLTPFAILLVVEREQSIGGTVQVQFGCGVGAELLLPEGEGNVAQAQWVVVSSFAVFTWTQQEVKGDPNHLDGQGELRAVAW